MLRHPILTIVYFLPTRTGQYVRIYARAARRAQRKGLIGAETMTWRFLREGPTSGGGGETARFAALPRRPALSALLFFPAGRHSAPPIALRRQCSQAANVIADENGGGKGRARAAAAAPAARTARGCGICWSTSGRTWRCVAERGGTEGHILLRSLAAAAAAVQTAPSGDHRERYECPERL